MSTDPARWLPRVRALQTVAQEGLTYASNAWDVGRYVRVLDLAAEIADDVLGDVPVAPAPVPHAAGDGAVGPDPRAEHVAAAVRAERGYLTPKLDVRAAVHDDRGHLLMVREVSDGRWALPGGWADVGETLAEGAIREVREETGYRVAVERLLGVYDRERTGHPPMLHFTLKAVLRCRVVGGEPTPSHETTQLGWFAPDALPPLSVQRNSPELLTRVFAHHEDPGLPPDL